MISKKSPKGNLEGKRAYFFQLGIVTALALVLVAFEWTQFHSNEHLLGQLKVNLDEEEMIPITVYTPPPPPPPPPPQVNPPIEVVDNNAQTPDIDIPPTETDPNEIVLFRMEPEPEPEPVEVPIFTVVEEMPSFPGGEEALYKFLAKNTRYPDMAKDAGVQGIVYLTFVIEEDGSINDVRLLRGIGGGCDEEAIRVMNKMPKWSPGKQRGRTVRVQYNMPFRFTLAN